MLTWKIVEVLKASVLYIYIYIQICLMNTITQIKMEKEKEKKGSCTPYFDKGENN